MKSDLYLQNGLIVTDSADFIGGIVVHDGVIIEVVAGDAPMDAHEIINVHGKVIMPGVIDSHTHLQEPGRSHWERYTKATMAGAAGGVTTVMDMPVDSTPSTVNKISLKLKRDIVQTDAYIDCAQWGGLVDNNLHDLDDLHAEGVIGLKAFMVETGIDDFKRVNDDLLYAGLLRTRKTGNVIGVHAENQWVTRYLTEKLQASGRVDLQAWLDSRPPVTELEAINRAIFWAQATSGNLHILHTTIASGVEAVAEARREGVNVTVETCPHYLFFDESDFFLLFRADFRSYPTYLLVVSICKILVLGD